LEGLCQLGLKFGWHARTATLLWCEMKRVLSFLLLVLSATAAVAEEARWFRGLPADEKSEWPYRYLLKTGGEKLELLLEYRIGKDAWLPWGEANSLVAKPGSIEFMFLLGGPGKALPADGKLEFPGYAAEGFKAKFTMPKVENDQPLELQFTPWTKAEQEAEAEALADEISQLQGRWWMLSKILYGAEAEERRGQVLTLEIREDGILTGDKEKLEVKDLEAPLRRLKAMGEVAHVKIVGADSLPWAKVRPVLVVCDKVGVPVDFAAPE
jgi:hypothetical protein